MCERDEFDKQYGNQCVRFSTPDGSAAVTVGGPELTIEVRGKVYRFEWSWGTPSPLNKRGDPKELGERDPFWHAVTCWVQQDRRLDENRRAIWEEPPKEDLSGYVKVGRNYYPKETHDRLQAKLNAKK